MSEIKKLKNTFNNWQEVENKTNEIIDNGGGGGGGTNAVWGRIEGNIVAQSDLMAQFATKADKTTTYNKTEVNAALAEKQHILTAGQGITIANNVIYTHIINDTLASATTTWSSDEIKSRFEAISGTARIEVVATLPATPVDNTLYYVGTQSPYSIKLQSNGVLYDMGTTEINLTQYYTKTETDTLINAKQDTLVSGTNIKTINNTSLLGSGNIDIGINAAFPVGSVYITIAETNPSTIFTGTTWQLIAGTNASFRYFPAIAKTGETSQEISEQLPNIKGSLESYRNLWSDNIIREGAIDVTNPTVARDFAQGTSEISTNNKNKVTFNAHDSNSIYTDNGHVQPNGITLFFWKRTA